MRIEHGGSLFAVARERGWDWREVLEASASINPLGPAAGVRDAIVDALDRIAYYPEQWPVPLLERLAEEWDVHPDQILVGNGATELLHYYARVSSPVRVALAVPTFSEFHRAWPTAQLVPWNDTSTWPADAFVVYTQPNNPLGRIAAAITDWPGGVMVDESFLEFTGAASAMGLTKENPHLLVLRSLTKFHGLPGLRLGALVGARETMAPLRARREPWQVNVLAEAAALAALADRQHGSRTREFVASERAWMAGRLSELPGMAVATSCANYLFAYLDRSAADLAAALLERKILVRSCTGTPGISGEGIRLAVRTRPENERLLRALEEYLCEH